MDRNEPEPGPSGIQLRINDSGGLRKPTEDKREFDQMQEEPDKQKQTMSSYQLKEISRLHNQLFNADNITYRPQVPHNLNNRRVSEILGEMYGMFNDLLVDLRNELQNGDLVRLYLNHPVLHTPIVIPARPIEDLTVEDIMTDEEKFYSQKKS